MGVGLFVFGIGFSPETIGDYREMMMYLYAQAERPATIGLGGLVGAIGWSMTGHQAGYIFVFRLPREWRLWAEKPWREKAPEEALPLFKSLVLGAVILTGGVAAGEWITDVSGRAFSIGLWIGGASGAAWSFWSFWAKSFWVDGVEEASESLV